MAYMDNDRQYDIGARLPIHRRVFVIVAAAVIPGHAAAQSFTPFETVDLSLHVQTNYNRNVFHDFWDSQTGMGGDVTFPFYRGAIGIGADFTPEHGRSLAQPDFTFRFLYALWRLESAPIGPIRIRAGGRVGIVHMPFPSGEGLAGPETEAAGALEAGLAVQVIPRWYVDVTTRYQVVFTSERIRLAYLAIGLRRRFDSPDWLRRFLQ